MPEYMDAPPETNHVEHARGLLEDVVIAVRAKDPESAGFLDGIASAMD